MIHFFFHFHSAEQIGAEELTHIDCPIRCNTKIRVNVFQTESGPSVIVGLPVTLFHNKCSDCVELEKNTTRLKEELTKIQESQQNYQRLNADLQCKLSSEKEQYKQKISILKHNCKTVTEDKQRSKSACKQQKIKLEKIEKTVRIVESLLCKRQVELGEEKSKSALLLRELEANQKVIRKYKNIERKMKEELEEKILFAEKGKEEAVAEIDKISKELETKEILVNMLRAELDGFYIHGETGMVVHVNDDLAIQEATTVDNEVIKEEDVDDEFPTNVELKALFIEK
jgi:hypothetical protein